MTLAAIEWIGFAAATLTTTAFVPQLARVLQLRSAREISLPTFLMFSLGVLLWLIYGIAIRSRPVIASNFVTLLLSLGILMLKLHYGDAPACGDASADGDAPADGKSTR